MINEGKSSYFTKIVTETVTKIVNVPILKNAGATTTCCLKNLSYGSLSNTSRLHKLWMKSVAEPCAFPVLRDKVVLNIVDGLQACYDGGPGANPKFIYDANVLLFGTDPVAVDAVAHDIDRQGADGPGHPAGGRPEAAERRLPGPRRGAGAGRRGAGQDQDQRGRAGVRDKSLSRAGGSNGPPLALALAGRYCHNPGVNGVGFFEIGDVP